jgi:hypothetical protein
MRIFREGPRGKKIEEAVEREPGSPIVGVTVRLEEPGKEAETSSGFIRWFWGKIGRRLKVPVAALYLYFAGLSGPALADNFWEKIAKAGLVIGVSKIVETLKKEEVKKKDEKLAKASYEATLELNNFNEAREFLNEGERFAIDDKDLKIDYYYPNIDLKGLTKHLIRRLLSELGIKEVSSIKGIEELTRERQELRANPEVIQEQVPPPGTLEPYQFKVRASVSIATDTVAINKALNLYLANLRGPKSIAKSVYESLRETEVLAIVVINIVNVRNGEEITLVGLGTPYILERASNKATSFYYQSRSKYFSGSSSQSEYKIDYNSVFNSLLSAFENLRKGFLEAKGFQQEGKLQEREEPIAWLVISIPHT